MVSNVLVSPGFLRSGVLGPGSAAAEASFYADVTHAIRGRGEDDSPSRSPEMHDEGTDSHPQSDNEAVMPTPGDLAMEPGVCATDEMAIQQGLCGTIYKRGNSLVVCRKTPLGHVHKDNTRPTQAELDGYRL